MTIKITQTEGQFYKTADLACATALSLFVQIQDIDKSNPRRALFVFGRSLELNQKIEQYHRGALKVEPLAYFNHLKALKTRLYEQN